MVRDDSRRGVLQTAVALGTLGYSGQAHADDAGTPQLRCNKTIQ
jgi:hypothetical protein